MVKFTVFTASEEDRTEYTEKLVETSTYQSMLVSLSDTIPDLENIYVANSDHVCEVGTKHTTVAGTTRCQSICDANYVTYPLTVTANLYFVNNRFHGIR